MPVVRGGGKLLKQRHNLDAAHKTEAQWRAEWETARWFLTADGESGKRFGNETIRLTPDGEISIKLPAPLAGLANARHGRYVLAARVSFPHRGTEWRDRITANRAVAYRIHYDVQRGRWYIDASWTRKDLPVVPLEALQAVLAMCAEAGLGVIAVDPPTPGCGGPSTGKPHSPHHDAPQAATRRPALRSGDAPSAIGSGDGRHRPHTTRAIVRGIGPPRPDPMAEGVRETAPAYPDH